MQPRVIHIWKGTGKRKYNINIFYERLGWRKKPANSKELAVPIVTVLFFFFFLRKEKEKNKKKKRWSGTI